MWQVDNKEWLKERKQGWKVLKKKLRQLFFLKEDPYYKVLKEYYLFGKQEIMPLSKVPAGLLFEFWLSPLHTKEQLRNLVSEYRTKGFADSVDSSARYFEEYACGTSYLDFSAESSIVNTNQSFFDGLEEFFFQ